jgi:hypothetical protein
LFWFTLPYTFILHIRRTQKRGIYFFFKIKSFKKDDNINKNILENIINEFEKKITFQKLYKIKTIQFCKENNINELNEIEENEIKSNIKNILNNNNYYYYFDRGNFQEALRYSKKIFKKEKIPDEVIEILNDDRAKKLTKER